MTLLPAVDLYGGKVVRLTKGDFGTCREYDVTPEEMAERFLAAGCEWIHIVDLEGAKAGQPRNLPVLDKIRSLGLKIQYGGGLRSLEAVSDALAAGADRVMVGSLFFKDTSACAEAARRFGDSVMAAVDVRGGRVVHSGWLEGTDMTAKEAVTRFVRDGISCFLVTDTERDGCMAGARAELYGALTGHDAQIIAAGGITSVQDIMALKAQGVDGVVIGKSLYEGGITLEAALAACEQ